MVLIESLQFPLHCRNTLLPTFLGYFWQANQRPQYVDTIVFPKQSDRQRWSKLPIQRSDKYVEDSMFKIGFDAVLDIPSHRGHMNDQSAAAILSQRASEKFGAPLWISEVSARSAATLPNGASIVATMVLVVSVVMSAN